MIDRLHALLFAALLTGLSAAGHALADENAANGDLANEKPVNGEQPSAPQQPASGSAPSPSEPAAEPEAGEAAAAEDETDADAKVDDDAVDSDTTTDDEPTGSTATDDAATKETGADETAADGTAADGTAANDAPTANEPAPEEPSVDPTTDESAAPGQADLDKAVELKLTARGMRDLNKVIELLDSAMELGVGEGNDEFADAILVAALLQRASAYASAVLDKPIANPRSNLRWLQIRQFALTDLQRALELENNLPEAHLLVGRLQLLPLGDPNAARRALGMVVAADGVSDRERARAYSLRGGTQRDSKKRLADFDQAVKLDPATSKYRLDRAREHRRQGDLDNALADAEAVLEQTPGDAAAHELKALVLLSQDKPAEAIESLDRATELDPQMLSPYQYRGEAYNRLGDTAEAIKQLNKAIEIDPNNLGSRLVRTQLYLMDGQPEAALADVESVLARQPGMLQAHMMRVQVLEDLGRREDAIEALERISQAAASSPAVLLQLAAQYQDFKEYRAAIDILSQVIEQADDSVLAFRLRGDMYLSLGEHTDALADFARAYELTPDDAGLLNNYAWTLATSPFDDLRDGPRAVELAKRAAQLTDFEKPHILSTLAAAYAEVGDFDQAIEYSEKALDLEQSKGAGPEAGPDLDDQLSEELASYREGKPWRELQQAEEEPSADEPSVIDTLIDPAVDPASDPLLDDEPARAFDF
ncbi:MAG: tetratricopeptide repeat protein [Planctomycetota bacterium]